MDKYIEVATQIEKQGYSIIDNFLLPEHANQLRDTALELISKNGFQPAKIGSHKNASTNQTIRSDQLHWIDEHSENMAVQIYLNTINSLQKTLNQQLFLGLVDFETHFALYPPGTYYKKHVDQFRNTQERRISVVYYLNKDWDASFGGELKLYDKSNHLITNMLPISNRLICFLSDLPHEVTETREVRLSIAGWMKSKRSIFTI